MVPGYVIHLAYDSVSGLERIFEHCDTYSVGQPQSSDSPDGLTVVVLSRHVNLSDRKEERQIPQLMLSGRVNQLYQMDVHYVLLCYMLTIGKM